MKDERENLVSLALEGESLPYGVGTCMNAMEKGDEMYDPLLKQYAAGKSFCIRSNLLSACGLWYAESISLADSRLTEWGVELNSGGRVRRGRAQRSPWGNSEGHGVRDASLTSVCTNTTQALHQLRAARVAARFTQRIRGH
jgi:hypothetical protein